MPGEINQDAPTVGFLLREFSQLGDNVVLCGLLVEKLGDVCGGNAHGRCDFACAVHVVGDAEKRRNLFIAVHRDSDDQGVTKIVRLCRDRFP